MAVITLRLDDGLIERLDAASVEHGVSRSDIVRGMLSERIPGSYAWIAYDPSLSTVVPFADEVTALRFAVGRGMHVVRVPYGTSVRYALQAKLDEATDR